MNAIKTVLGSEFQNNGNDDEQNLSWQVAGATSGGVYTI